MLIWLGMTTRLEAMISMIEDDMAQSNRELLCAISLERYPETYPQKAETLVKAIATPACKLTGSAELSSASIPHLASP